MKIEEAKECLRAIRVRTFYDGESKWTEALDIATEALEHQQKYRWHDLIKNPSELPDDETMVIIQTVTHHQFFAYIRDEQWFIDGEGLFSLADVNDGHISAWRDYDEFEEGEEE